MIRTVLLKGVLAWGLTTGLGCSLIVALATDESFVSAAAIAIPVFCLLGTIPGYRAWLSSLESD